MRLVPRALVLALLAAGAALAGDPPTPTPPPAPPAPKPAPAPATPQAAPKAPAPAPKAKARVDDEPTVLTTEQVAELRRKTARNNRYGGPADARDVSAWNQASFFGLRAEGRVFIFVVDRSGSMDDGDRLDRAKRELMRAVGAMQPPQRFHVLFYNDETTMLPGDLPKPADYPARDRLARWLHTIDAIGGTDPRAAMSLALGMRPDAVFLLSDGAFPPGTAEAIGGLNPRKIPIHCVDLGHGAGGDDLRVIARDSGGQYSGGGGR